MQNAKIKRTLSAQEKKTIFSSPAFPPQLFKDNFERIMAPVPGMNKIEFTAALILPFYLAQSKRTKLMHNGKEINAVQAAVITARDLMEECIEEIFEEASIINNE
jgi:hypothetical protein